MFGSFSHTREEIRDGESINFPYQFLLSGRDKVNNNRDDCTAPSSYNRALSRRSQRTKADNHALLGSARLAAISLSAHSPPKQGSGDSTTSQASSAPASTPAIDSPSFSDPFNSVSTSVPHPSSTSNLAKARPSHLELPAPDPHSGEVTSTPSPIAEEPSSLEPSPSSSTERTPLASQLALPVTSEDMTNGGAGQKEDDPSPVSSASGGEGGKTPTPKRMIQQAAKERRKSGQAPKRDVQVGVEGLRKRAKKGKEEHEERDLERILGDERGGSRDEQYDGIEDSEGEEEAEESTADEDSVPTERTPLFGLTGQRGGREISVDKDGFVYRARNKMLAWGNGLGAKAKKTRKEDFVDFGKTAVSSIPAVILG